MLIIAFALSLEPGASSPVYAADKGDPPVAYWRLDEGSGAIAYDDSDNNNDGTITGATWVPGKYDSALNFDGNDYVNCGTNSVFNVGTGAHTIEAWVYPAVMDTGTYHYIAAIGDNATGAQSGLGIRDYHLYLSGYSSPIVTTAYMIPALDRWYYISMVYSGGVANFYVDGALKESENISLNVTTGKCRIGVHIGDTSFFKGKMDNVKIYNYARTAEQIAVDYNAGFAAHLGAVNLGIGMDPNEGVAPVAYWKFDENTGVIAYDASGNERNGTLTNGPEWAQGKIGPCLNFDGIDDKVSITSPSVGAGEVTISFWAFPRALSSESVLGNTSTYTRLVQIKDADTMEVNFGEAGVSNLFDITSVFQINTWQFITVTKDSSNNIKIYLNGADVTLGAPTIANTVNITYTNIGARKDDLYFDGLLDDIRIYNYARTPAQIAWDYNKGKPVAYWRFDEGSGTTAKDDTGSNNGTITIGALGSQATIGSAWTNGVTGKFGKCMSFDGTDDYVSLGSGILNASSGTVQMWAKANDFTAKAFLFSHFSGTDNRVYIARYAGSASINAVLGTNVNKNIGTLTADEWAHLTVTWDGGNYVTYFNGKFTESGTYSGLTSSAGSPYIGGWPGQDFFKGLIDDVRIYNYARTAGQVMQDYNQGLAVKLGD
jgi:hypothetical protein